MAEQGAGENSLERETLGESDDPRLLAAVKEYMDLLDRGERPSRAAFVAQHAEVADALDACLAGLELVHLAAGPTSPQDGFGVGLRPLPGEAPRSLGDFRILRELGRGGMGVVYEALQMSLARRVALKVLPSFGALNPVRLERFTIEAQAAARLQHPHIVPVFAVGSEGSTHYFAMQLIEGYTLAEAIQYLRLTTGRTAREAVERDAEVAQTQLPPGRSLELNVREGATRAGIDISTKRSGAAPAATRPRGDASEEDPISHSALVTSYATRTLYFREAATLIQQAADAIDYAHQCGLIHRDVKPGNLLLDARGHVWVADFGLALDAAGSQLTHTGDALGTLRYMSPEQAGGKRAVIDQRSDVYSLGSTLYELLTLDPVLGEGDRVALLRAVLEDEPRPPRAIDPALPVELQTIALKALAKAPGERYGSAGELAEDLGRWLRDEPIVAQPPTVWERARKWRRRHRTLVRMAGVFGVLALVGLATAMGVVSRAYQREAAERAQAERNFAQARQAVDAFSELAETELAAKPEMRDVRRRLMETALDYYRQFAAERGAASADAETLAAATERIARIVDELRVLDGSASLLLLSDRRVQRDLELTAAQRTAVEKQLAQLVTQRNAATDDPGLSALDLQHQIADLLRSNEAAITAVLDERQRERVQQIARQQRAPFVFRTLEVVDALGLTAEQRRQVSTIIEEERIDGGGRASAGQGGPSGGGMREPRAHGDPEGELEEGAPSSFGEGEPTLEAVREFQEWWYGAPAGSGGGFDGGPGRPNGRGGGDFGGGPPELGRGPREPRPGGGPGFGGPPSGDFERFGRGPGSDRGGPGNAMSGSKVRTTKRILAILTDKQRARWAELVGDLFPYDLQWGPDSVLPR